MRDDPMDPSVFDEQQQRRADEVSEALGADVSLPVTGLTVYTQRQEIARLRQQVEDLQAERDTGRERAERVAETRNKFNVECDRLTDKNARLAQQVRDLTALLDRVRSLAWLFESDNAERRNKASNLAQDIDDALNG